MAYNITSKDMLEAVGEGGQLSGMDRRLLEWASMNYTGEQMSEELGGVITPARAMQRVRELTKAQNWTSIIEKQSLLMLDMIELKNILFDRVRNEGGFVEKDGKEFWSDGDPRWSANLIRLMREFRAMITETKVELDKNKGSIDQAHGQLMFGAIELAFERLAFEVEKREHAALSIEPPAWVNDDPQSLKGWRAAISGVKRELPTRGDFIEIVERALPKAMEAIEAKVVD